MKIEKMPYCFYDCNFFMKIGNEEIRVASLVSQLVGLDKMFLCIDFPIKGCSEITLDMKYHTYQEVLEQAKRIVCKKMYKYSQDILKNIITTELH